VLSARLLRLIIELAMQHPTKAWQNHYQYHEPYNVVGRAIKNISKAAPTKWRAKTPSDSTGANGFRH